jgi:hypothetical protein
MPDNGSHILPSHRTGEMRGAPGSTPPPVTAPDEALPYLGGRALGQPPAAPDPRLLPCGSFQSQEWPHPGDAQFHSLYVNCPAADCWGNPEEFQADLVRSPFIQVVDRYVGYALKAGQLTYDCRYSTMHGMPVTGGRGFRGLKPLWYNGVPP